MYRRRQSTIVLPRSGRRSISPIDKKRPACGRAPRAGPAERALCYERGNCAPLESAAEQLRDEKDHHGAKKAATEEQVQQRITGCRDRHGEKCEFHEGWE